jgi:RNA polymerase sigma-70 factor (ECF subfamily)
VDEHNHVVSKGEEPLAASLRAIETRVRVEDCATLIKRVASGDQSALTALYDGTNRLAYGLVLRVLQDTAAAEEVLLDVYMQVWRQAALYDERRGTPLAWLLTIARSRAIDRLRSGKSDKQRHEPIECADRLAHTADVADAAVVAETQTLVRAALNSLAPEQKEVIELAYYLGLTHTEIAARLGQPLGTVKTRTRLGMIKLRETLRPVYDKGLI